MRTEVAEYTRLPQEILKLILRRLALTDCLRFASVCTSWRLALSECRLLPPRRPPWLMYGGAPAGSRRSLSCYSLLEGRHIELQLPAGYESSHIAGTSSGWLIMSSDAERRMALLNPVSKAQIELPANLHPSHHPGFKFFEDTPVGAKRHICTLWKAALSSVPTASNCIVAVKGTDGVMIWCRVGDSEWRVFDDGLRVYSDFIFLGGRLYAAGVRGEVVVVGFDEPEPRVTDFLVLPWTTAHGTLNKNLIESGGELMMVAQFPGYVHVFKLDMANQRWVAVKSLGDQVLFVGRRRSESLPADECILSGLRGNCIYVTSYVSNKMVEFSMKDGSRREICLPGPESLRHRVSWFTPSAW